MTIKGENGGPTTRRRRLQANIDHCETEFQRTGNPIFVWEALVFIEKSQQPPPTWVMAYLYRSARRIYALESKPPAQGKIHTAIATALEFASSSSGEKNPLDHSRRRAVELVRLSAVIESLGRLYPAWQPGDHIKWNNVFEQAVRLLPERQTVVAARGSNRPFRRGTKRGLKGLAAGKTLLREIWLKHHQHVELNGHPAPTCSTER